MDKRHRAFQVIITGGSFGSFLVAILFPHAAVEAAVIGLVTNLIWVWEH